MAHVVNSTAQPTHEQLFGKSDGPWHIHYVGDRWPFDKWAVRELGMDPNEEFSSKEEAKRVCAEINALATKLESDSKKKSRPRPILILEKILREKPSAGYWPTVR